MPNYGSHDITQRNALHSKNFWSAWETYINKVTHSFRFRSLSMKMGCSRTDVSD